MRTLLRAAAVLAIVAGPAAAAVELQKLGWQMTPLQGARATVKTARPIETLGVDFSPKGKLLPGRLMGTVKILNRGQAVEGILLRYSVTGKIAPADGSSEAAWVLPFMLETRRVPKAGANSVLDVPLEATALIELYLKKLKREGYRLRELKMQVMVEPRKGASTSVQIMEAALPVEDAAK